MFSQLTKFSFMVGVRNFLRDFKTQVKMKMIHELKTTLLGEGVVYFERKNWHFQILLKWGTSLG